MGLLDVLRKARGDAGISATRDVSLWAQLTARGRGPTAGQLAGAGAGGQMPLSTKVPEATERSLVEQGMVWGDPFSPGSPVPPYEPEGTPPVRRVFRIGENVYLQPRASAGVDFSTMQQILDKWDLANLCINTRIDQLRLPDWTIEPRERADMERYADEAKALRAFFERPDGDTPFDVWLSRWMRDWLRYDAACIFRHRTRGGKLAALEVIDGTTIALLSDGRGGIPKPPAPAFVQWAWGLPWVWMTTRDLIYEPYWPRSQSRYGMPPIEWLLIQGNTDLRLQLFFLEFFTEGEVPATWLEAPDNVTPEQLNALQAKYNALLAGQRGVHHKVAFIPHGTKPYPMKEQALSAWVPFANHVVVKACSAFGVQPAEIGWTENVNKASSSSQEDIQFRRSVLPSARYVEKRINRILAEDFNAPWARFKFLNIEEEEDRLKRAQEDEILIRMGVKSPDTAAIERGLPVDPDNPVGRMLIVRDGALMLADVKARSAALVQQASAQAGLDPNAVPDEDDTDDEAEEGVGSTETAAQIRPGNAVIEPRRAADKALRDDLRKWRDLAVSRAKAGKAQRPFVSDHIPAALAQEIAAGLAKAADPAAVRAVFAPYLSAASGGSPLDKAARRRPEPLKHDPEARRAIEEEAAAVVRAFFAEEGPRLAAYVEAHWPKALGKDAAAPEGPRQPPESLLQQILHALDRYDWSAWSRLAERLIDPIRKAAEKAAVTAIAAVQVTVEQVEARVSADALAYAQQRAAEMVGRRQLADGSLVPNPNAQWRIDESTRRMIRDDVERAIRRGDGAYQARQDIQKSTAFSNLRAETIARTETALAYNRGALAGYRAAGVDRVRVYDGDHDEECRTADGQVWSVDYAEDHPLEHPNCLRGFSALPPGDETPIDRV